MKYSVSMKNNHEFRRLYAKGKSVSTPTLVIYFRKFKRDYNQIGVTVSTKVGKAVIRNHIRRRIRAIYRLNEEKLSRGMDIVVVARVRSRHADYAQLEKDFLHACKRLGIIDESGADQ